MILDNIQILRFFALSNVLLFHITEYSKSYNYKPQFFSFFEGWGQNGVDIFFVITGFVIYISNKNDLPSNFIKKRFLRIVPLYYFSTFIFILIFIFFNDLFRNDKISYQDIFKTLLFVSVLFKENPIIDLGWTIEFEIYFSIIFFISLFLKNLKNRFLIIIIIISIISLYSLLIVEFMFGLIIGYLYEKNFFLKFSKYFLVLGLILLISSKLVNIHLYNLNELRVLIYGIPSSLIIIGLANYKNLNIKIFAYLGKVSFSIYLIQVFTIPAMLKLNNFFKINFIYDDIFILIIYFVSILFGIFSFHILEKKILNVKKY